MIWNNIHLRSLLLILISALHILMPIASAADAATQKPAVIDAERVAELQKKMPPERIERIIERAEQAAAKIDLDAIADRTEKFTDKGFLHQITHQREMFLEKVEAVNETPVYVLKGLGTVTNLDPSNCRMRFDLFGAIEGLDLADNLGDLGDGNIFGEDNAADAEKKEKSKEAAKKRRASKKEYEDNLHYSMYDEVHLAIMVKDLLRPTLHFGSLLLDIDSVAEYFDTIIEIIANAVIHKEDVVLYNLNIMLQTSDEELFAAAFKNLNEALQKSMHRDNQMHKLTAKFFQKRILPICLEHVKKTLRPTQFILSRTPKLKKDFDAANASKDIPVISVSDHWAFRVAAQPLLAAMTDQFDLKINELVSGYKDKRPVPVFSATENALKKIFLNTIPIKFFQNSLGTALEFAKQMGYADTFDETLWFTLSTELMFNLYVFYRTFDATIKDQLLDMLVKESIGLKESIENFERRLANQRNASQEKQAEIKQAFKEEIYTVTIRHFAPLQPVLLEKMRRQHATFETLSATAMLMPVILPMLKGVWHLVQSTSK